MLHLVRSASSTLIKVLSSRRSFFRTFPPQSGSTLPSGPWRTSNRVFLASSKNGRCPRGLPPVQVNFEILKKPKHSNPDLLRKGSCQVVTACGSLVAILQEVPAESHWKDPKIHAAFWAPGPFKIRFSVWVSSSVSSRGGTRARSDSGMHTQGTPRDPVFF